MMNLQIHILSVLGHIILASNITIFATMFPKALSKCSGSTLNTIVSQYLCQSTSSFNLQIHSKSFTRLVTSQAEGVLVLCTLSYIHTRIALFIGRFFFYCTPKPYRAVCSLLCRLCDFLDCTSLYFQKLHFITITTLLHKVIQLKLCIKLLSWNLGPQHTLNLKRCQLDYVVAFPQAD